MPGREKEREWDISNFLLKRSTEWRLKIDNTQNQSLLVISIPVQTSREEKIP